MTPVLLTSTVYGEQPAVATSIAADEVHVETVLAYAVGAAVLVTMHGEPATWEWWARVARVEHPDHEQPRRVVVLRVAAPPGS